MSYLPSSDTQLAQFAYLLAELESRLRLFPVNSHGEAASWSVLSRLGVQAKLLTGLAGESDQDDFLKFSQALDSLVSLGLEEPLAIPEQWREGMYLLAAFMDDLAQGLDSGESLAQWLDDPQWSRLISWFTHFQTPYLVMDQLEELLLQWQNSWCDEAFEQDQELELQKKWARLRKFGDALFQSSAENSESNLLRWKGFSPES